MLQEAERALASTKDLFDSGQITADELQRAAGKLCVLYNTIGSKSYKAHTKGDLAPNLFARAMKLTDEETGPMYFNAQDELQTHLRATTLNNMGCMERTRGNNEAALLHLRQCSVLESHNSPATNLNISAILTQMGRHAEAIGSARRSIGLLLAKQDKCKEDYSVLVIAYHNLAMAQECSSAVEDRNDAKANYTAALQIATKELGEHHPTTVSVAKSLRTVRQHPQRRDKLSKHKRRAKPAPTHENEIADDPPQVLPDISPLAQVSQAPEEGNCSPSALEGMMTAETLQKELNPNYSGDTGMILVDTDREARPGKKQVKKRRQRRAVESRATRPADINHALRSPQPPKEERRGKPHASVKNLKAHSHPPDPQPQPPQPQPQPPAAPPPKERPRHEPQPPKDDKEKKAAEKAAEAEKKKKAKEVPEPEKRARTRAHDETRDEDRKKEDAVTYMHQLLVKLLRDEDVYEQQFQAALRIQCTVRCLAAHVAVDRAKEARRREQSHRLFRENDSAKIVTRFIRKVADVNANRRTQLKKEETEHERRDHAAVRIQKTARGWLARRKTKWLRTYYRRVHWGTRVLQCFFRRMKALLIAKKRKAAYISIWQDKLARERVTTAATKIAKVYRGYKARLLTDALRGRIKRQIALDGESLRHHAATKIAVCLNLSLKTPQIPHPNRQPGVAAKAGRCAERSAPHATLRQNARRCARYALPSPPPPSTPTISGSICKPRKWIVGLHFRPHPPGRSLYQRFTVHERPFCCDFHPAVLSVGGALITSLCVSTQLSFPPSPSFLFTSPSSPTPQHRAYCASMIQDCWRRYEGMVKAQVSYDNQKTRVMGSRRQRRQHAALAIQSCLRQRFARCRAKALRRERRARLDEQKRAHSATIIAAMWRAVVARVEVTHRRGITNDAVAHRKHAMHLTARKIQGHARMYLARRALSAAVIRADQRRTADIFIEETDHRALQEEEKQYDAVRNGERDTFAPNDIIYLKKLMQFSEEQNTACTHMQAIIAAAEGTDLPSPLLPIFEPEKYPSSTFSVVSGSEGTDYEVLIQDGQRTLYIDRVFARILARVVWNQDTRYITLEGVAPEGSDTVQVAPHTQLEAVANLERICLCNAIPAVLNSGEVFTHNMSGAYTALLEKCVVRLQSFVRGCRARTLRRHLTSLCEEELQRTLRIQAAMRLQAWFRQNNARITTHKIKELREQLAANQFAQEEEEYQDAAAKTIAAAAKMRKKGPTTTATTATAEPRVVDPDDCIEGASGLAEPDFDISKFLSLGAPESQQEHEVASARTIQRTGRGAHDRAKAYTLHGREAYERLRPLQKAHLQEEKIKSELEDTFTIDMYKNVHELV